MEMRNKHGCEADVRNNDALRENEWDEIFILSGSRAKVGDTSEVGIRAVSPQGRH